jgi:glycosyltransferase involved in cell wall biosynthesis
MVVYNGERYLREAVESIISQTYSDFEFIIVDDGSTDSTPEILEEYSRKDKRIKVVRNERNMGIPVSRNKAIKLAEGEYIVSQDSDDVSMPDRLGKMVSYLDEHPEIGVLGTWIANIDEKCRRTGEWRTHASHVLNHWELLFRTFTIGGAVMIRRNLLDADKTYNPDFPVAEDYELWIRLTEKTRLGNVPETLYMRRYHRQMSCEQDSELMTRLDKALKKQYHSRLLGEEVPDRMIEMFYNFFKLTEHRRLENASEIRELDEYMLRLYNTYVEKNKLNASERREVAENAADWLEKLALFHIRRWPLEAGRILLHSIRLRGRIPVESCVRVFGYYVRNLFRGS